MYCCTGIMFLQGLEPLQCMLGFLFVVCDYSGSLQQWKPYKTQRLPELLELLYGRHCAIVPVFLVLCVLFTTFSASL